MTASPAVSALRNAIALPDPTGAVELFQQFVRVLRGNDLLGSMGQVGACGDNAAMESFFSLLQKNVLNT
jgi:hypothetical protein